MTESTPEFTESSQTEQSDGGADEDVSRRDEIRNGLEPDDSFSLDEWKYYARKQEERAKSNHSESEKLRGELDQLKRDQMSEQERAIAEARDAGRSEAMREASGRLVDAEVKAAAVNRPVNVDALLSGLDRTQFLDEAGEVDGDAVSTWLDQLAPVSSEPRPASDLGQGTRGVNRSDPADVFGQLITGKIT